MVEAIEGLSARFYSWLTGRSSIIKTFHEMTSNEVQVGIDSGEILDVGTGPGFLPLKVASKNPGIKITGIDISGEMVRIACNNALEAGVGDRVSFIEADVRKMPFDDESFDLIVSTGSFHHWNRPIEGINEIFRVLKKGCEAWIYDIDRKPSQKCMQNFRGQYGYLGSVLYRFVRSHSSISQEYIQSKLEEPVIKFLKYEVKKNDKIPVLKIILRRDD
jgi:ubiquinone/menaquinone biosynthesis C-methylase UbiE